MSVRVSRYRDLPNERTISVIQEPCFSNQSVLLLPQRLISLIDRLLLGPLRCVQLIRKSSKYFVTLETALLEVVIIRLDLTGKLLLRSCQSAGMSWQGHSGQLAT